MPLDPLEIIGGLAIGEGLGGAIADTVTPRLQNFKNDQWSAHTDKPLDAASAAEVAAEKYAALDAMQLEASFTGYDAERFQHLYDITVTAPGMGELLTMLRRGTISSGNFQHGLDKARLEPMWSDALAELATVYVGIGDIAYGIVRGILPAPSWVPVAPPAHGDKVPRFPQVDIDPIGLAGKLGFSEDMLKLMTGRSGLSMAPGLAAQALFRDIIGPNDFLLAIAEGDLRTEWAESVREVSRQILTSGEYAELQLRGFSTAAERRANTAKHGMSTADSDLLYDVLGRAPGIHAVTTGLARGGTYDGQPKTIPEPFLSAVQRANIRPEWYDIEYANRYTYPSAFVMRALAQSGDLGDQAAVEQDLLELGWKPSLAHKVSVSWTTTGSTADSHLGKAQTQLWTTTHRSYVAEEIDDATATAALSAAGVAAATVPAILTLWAHERSLVRKQLSPTQIRKALNLGVVNPATGVAWTVADAHAALLDRGYADADATVFLQE